MPIGPQLSRRALLAGALGLAVTLAGCARTPSSAADSLATGGTSNGPGATSPADASVDVDRSAPTSVVVIGDSITDGSAAELDAALRAVGVDDITIDAQVSRRIAVGGGPNEPRSGVQALQRLLDTGAAPDVWVIALGTNDVDKYADDDYPELVRTLLDMVPSGAPVVWVDVHVPARRAATATFDEVLRDVVGDRDGATVASWRETVTGSDRALLRDDDLHPNARGSEAFADLVAEAVTDAASETG